jgi:hypothetical protein
MKLPPDVRRRFVDGVADVRQENDPVVFVAHFRVDTLFDVFYRRIVSTTLPNDFFCLQRRKHIVTTVA